MTTDHQRALELLGRLRRLIPRGVFAGRLLARNPKLAAALEETDELLASQYGRGGPTTLYRPLRISEGRNTLVAEGQDGGTIFFVRVDGGSERPAEPHLLVDGEEFFRWNDVLPLRDVPPMYQGKYEPVVEIGGTYRAQVEPRPAQAGAGVYALAAEAAPTVSPQQP